MGGHGPVLWGISLGVADHHGGMGMNDDMVYIQSLRDRAIGFEMQAFYDDRLKQMRDARFRQLRMMEHSILDWRRMMESNIINWNRL